MNMNYLTLPLLTFNIVLTCAVAQKVFYPKSADVAFNEEIHGECEAVEVVQAVEVVEAKPKNLGWYNDDCDIQRMNMARALDHYKRGLITKPKAKQIRDHYRKRCA